MNKTPEQRSIIRTIDENVGSRIKLRRRLLGVTQEILAGDIGVTFQQIQKYETGTNRVSASTLLLISAALNVKPSFFFEDLPEDVVDQLAKNSSQEFQAAMVTESTAEGMRLLNAYRRLNKPARDAFIKFLECAV